MDKEPTYVTAYTGDDNIPGFVTFCIEQYKNYKGISGAKAMQILSDAGVIEYLATYYPALHLESSQWLLKEMDDLVNSKILRV